MSDINRNKTKLHPPFKGRWRVHAGGDTKELNHHHGNFVQKFAFDFEKVNEEDKDYNEDGKNLENYYAFEEEVLAPGNGIVIEAVDGVRDNVLFTTNPYMAIGNYVMIKHSDDEFSVLAHLKKGSVEVQEGDKVKAGGVIGLCGNSGNSSQPHLHYHLQDSPHFAVFTKNGREWVARAVKTFFSNVTLEKEGNTESQKEYSPIRGDVIIGGSK